MKVDVTRVGKLLGSLLAIVGFLSSAYRRPWRSRSVVARSTRCSGPSLGQESACYGPG